MIRHHLPTFEEKKLAQFQIDEKKLVKIFIYQNQGDWIEYFTGFLFMEPNPQGKVDLKIRFSRHPHLAQIGAGLKYPLELFTDECGLYTLIQESTIKTVEKPEQNVLYLKIGKEGRIIAISFHSKSYCKALLEHLTLVLENDESEEMTWTDENLKFLNASVLFDLNQMKQNLMYVDSVFILQERITEFCTFFNKVDKRLYETPRDPDSQDQKYMFQFFEIVKNVFLRANEKIINMFISKKEHFQTLLKCLSYNPFGLHRFDYFREFNNMTVIRTSILDSEGSHFWNSYEMITRVKFLRDVAICTFIEIPTDAVFNQLLNKAYVQILQALGDPKSQLIEKLYELSQKDEQTYICVFSQIWEIFKAFMEGAETMIIKEVFYLSWIQNGMFSQTLSAMGRLLKQKQVADIHPRFWQKWMESMNPMLSYEWNESQKIIINHQNTINSEQTMDLMSSLIMILANCDSNTKTLVLDFVRVQIELSENRKHVSAKYLSYLFNSFVAKSCEYCNNEDDIEKYIEFVQKIYVAQPIRTRHFIVQTKLMTMLKPYFQNKFIFIMLLKLLKTFIEVGDKDTFRFLATGDFYDCVRQKYALNQHLRNITNSLFLSIFKVIENIQNKEVKKYLYRIFFAVTKEESREMNLGDEESERGKWFKRGEPVSGFENQMECEK